MRRARIAVIGTGWWATAVHIPALARHPDAELAALVDRDPQRLAAAVAASGVAPESFTDHQTMLERVRPDAVVVATTHATHHAIARDCLDAGCHVLVEKPLTLTAVDARDLVERAERAGRSLLCGYPYNHTPLVRRCRELVAGGALGPVQFVHCLFNSYHLDLLSGRDATHSGYAYPVHGPGSVYSDPAHSGGGHGHLQLTHAAGLLFFVSGLRVRRVQARMAHHGLAVDLVDAILTEFDGGAIGMMGGTSNGHLRKVSLALGCADGSVDIDLVAGTAALRRARGDAEEIAPEEQVYPGDAPVANLIAVARGLEAPLVRGEVGWRAVELLDAAYRSAAADGRTVAVEELYA